MNLKKFSSGVISLLLFSEPERDSISRRFESSWKYVQLIDNIANRKKSDVEIARITTS